jgi:hypothetical protein
MKHQSPPLALLAVAYVALFAISLAVTMTMTQGQYPSPFAPEMEMRAFFVEHARAVRIGAFLQLCSAIPLGLFAAVASSRLRFLGIDAVGESIAFFGGAGACLLLVISALTAWTLGSATVTDATQALLFLAFATGGPGFAVLFGLLAAGVSVSAGLPHLVPRWLMWFGLVIAAAGGLASLTLVTPGATYFIPLVRFIGFVWLIVIGAKLPRSRADLPQAENVERGWSTFIPA